jgi:tetratricopeptide (TPR) repeat protein
MKHAICVTLAVCLAAPLLSHSQSLMKQGTEAANAGRYMEAASYFRQAVQTHPQTTLAWQHLANAEVRAFLHAPPGADREALVGAARNTLNSILSKDPNDALALWDLSMLEMSAKRFDQALDAAVRLTVVRPADKQAHYQAGVIEWARAYPELGQAKPFGPETGKLRTRHAPGLAAGHAHLQRALELDPGFRDALAYDNLLYRLDAVLASTAEEVRALHLKADERMRAAMAAKPGAMKAVTAVLRPDAPPPPVAPPPPPPPPPPPQADV